MDARKFYRVATIVFLLLSGFYLLLGLVRLNDPGRPADHFSFTIAATYFALGMAFWMLRRRA